MMVNAAFDMTLPYDIDKDLTPVVRFFDVPILVAANNDAPFKSMAELRRLGQERTRLPTPMLRAASAVHASVGES